MEVRATRMELFQQRKKLALAKRGHKLLKDKQEELMRKLLDLVKKTREMMKEVEKEIEETMKRFVLAKSMMDPLELEEALLMTRKKVKLSLSLDHILNVRVPVFGEKIEGDIFSYGFTTTNGELDAAFVALDRVIEKLLKVAEMEKSLELLALEIEKTRRRVNALEYRLIPETEEIVRYIKMRLAEMERGNISRLMRIKEIVRAH